MLKRSWLKHYLSILPLKVNKGVISWKRIIYIYRSVAYFYCYFKSITTNVNIFFPALASSLSSKFIYPIFYYTFLLEHFKFNISKMKFLIFFPRSTAPKFFLISGNGNSIPFHGSSHKPLNQPWFLTIGHIFHFPLSMPSKLALYSESPTFTGYLNEFRSSLTSVWIQPMRGTGRVRLMSSSCPQFFLCQIAVGWLWPCHDPLHTLTSSRFQGPFSSLTLGPRYDR